MVYESTVYPGCIEEDCVPVLEQVSGLKAGGDFTVGYSPERINPGDKKHRFETITKVVAGQDARTLDIVADVYGSVVTAGIHRAPSIKVAEAAKVIENTQRDLNIAFMNELSAICHRLGIDTGDVLAAARHQMEFPEILSGSGRRTLHRRRSVLPHASAPRSAGYHPEVILAGRRINDNVGQRVARACVQTACSGASARQCGGHRARPDVQGKRAGYPQLESRRYRERTGDCRGRRASA